MQLPAIRIAREKGWHVIVADGNPEAPGRKQANRFEQVDLKDLDGMYQAALFHKEKRGLDGVFTAGTDFSTTVAYVAEKLSLPGIPYEVALTASDKERMRSCFREKNIPSPRFWSLSSMDDLQEIRGELTYPLVVKPVDNMGSRGIRKVSDGEELHKALPEAFRFSRSGKVIIEEYISGPEFSTDAVVWDGKIRMCGFADRHIYFEPYFVELGHTMPTDLDADTRRSIEEVFFMGIEAIGITRGAAKGDIKLSAKGPIIGEIAARLSGGYMSGWTFPYHSGVEVTEAALNIAVGDPPGNLEPRKNLVAAERAFISIPGTVKDLLGEKNARTIPGIQEVFLTTARGDSVCFPTNNVQKCGNVIALNDKRKDAVKTAQQGTISMQVILEPDTEDTRDFLLRKGHFWVPDAYTLRSEQNQRALSDMPPGFVSEYAQCAAILPLPVPEDEGTVDWNGIPFHTALDRVLRHTRCRWITSPEMAPGGYFLGSLFWRVFLRGGYQGGIWIIESLNLLSSNKEKMDTFIALWE